MPPVYKPLSSAGGIQGAPGLPASVFSDPGTTSLEDEMKALALQRAQELSNQSNEINVAEKQRVADQQKQLREALQTQYGEGDINSFNPDEALQTAQRIALQSGDLDTALNIEKITKERQQGTAPLTPAQRQFLAPVLGNDIPEGITSSDVNLRGALQRGSIYAQQVNETIDKRQDNLQSLAPGGFEATIDPKTGQGPTVTDGKKFTATVAAHSRINSDLDMLEASLAISDGNDPSSPEFQRQKAILGDIMIALKEKNNFGAALTNNEQLINNSALPQIFARTDVGMGEALVRAGLGRDPIDAINTLRSLLSTDFDQQAVIYKFRPKADSTGLPLAQSGTSFRIPRANGMAGQPITQENSSFPSRPGLTYSGIDQASGLPIYKRNK